jgi:hypothetical protein
MRIVPSLVALVGATATARADEGYRTDLAIVDGATIALVTAGVALGDDDPRSLRSRIAGPLLHLGALSLALGPPIVHAVHGHPGRALASYGLRFGPPAAVFLGFVLAALPLDCHEASTRCGDDTVMVPAIALAYLAGVAIDYALVPPGEPAQSRMLSISVGF